MAKIEVIKEPVAAPASTDTYVYTGEKNYETPKVDPWIVEEESK